MFSGLVFSAMDLISSRRVLSLQAPSAILEFILEGTPDIRESFVDSKRDVDLQLKRSCQSLISNSASKVTAPIHSYLSEVEKFLKARRPNTSPSKDLVNNVLDSISEEERAELMKTEFMEAENVARVVGEAVRNAKVNIPTVLRSLRLYLANRDTEMILYRPIKVFFLEFFPRT